MPAGFAASQRKHMGCGRRVPPHPQPQASQSPATDEPIEEGLAVCRSCEHFVRDAKNGTLSACSKCGCAASARVPEFVSKLAAADQECPLGKWPKLAELFDNSRGRFAVAAGDRMVGN